MITNRQIFLHNLAQTSDMPLALEIERAEGVYLYDTHGKKYLDLISGIAVSSLGHRHPHIQAAIEMQLNKYWHTMVYGEFVLSPQVELASLLTSQLDPKLNNVYLVNSGTEATEGAMKLAKRYTGRFEIISCIDAYHGSTQGAMSLMSDTYFTEAYRPLLPGISHIEFNNEATLQNINTKTAAVIIEPVQAESGIIIPTNDFLQKVRTRCDEVGALLIFDEIQSGYGRTGYLFAHQYYGVVPDILLLAKGFGGGMPIGAFVSSKAIMSSFMDNPVLGHITTFGGHPVCAAAALATLQVLTSSDLISQVAHKNKLFLENLQHSKIKEIRHAGLWFALELDSFETVSKTIQKAMELGLIVDWFLFNNRSIRICPPLIISDEQILDSCEKLKKCLE
jgi:acetylornithine/N-succinyldiaminopimelate aminotransferase